MICPRCIAIGAEAPRVAVCASCRELARNALTPEQCATSLKALKLHRHELVRTLPKNDGGSLVPFLKASLTVTAIDAAISLLERELKAGAS